MTDVLRERFAALADPTDDSNWLEVRRRARRRRFHGALPAAALAAAAVAAAAVAAGNGWFFASHDREVTAVTHVSLDGRTWRVSLTTGPRGRPPGFCVRLARDGGPTITPGCGPQAPRPLGPPFGALHVDVPGGQIWVGATVAFTRRISITDANGRVRSTSVVAAPRGTRTPFRYWVLATDAPARAIAAYDARGDVIRKRL